MSNRSNNLRFLILALLVTCLGWGQLCVADTLSSGGINRIYSLYAPDRLDKAHAQPLVIVLHGGFGKGTQAEKAYGWDELANKQGFIVAYPDGLGHSWNAGGGCCGPAYRDNVDDVGFLNDMVHAIMAVYAIDPRRIYVTGMSNGAAMAYRYGCESDVVAAVGAVSGDMTASCQPRRPLSVMEIHGLADRNIPFDGGHGTKGVTTIAWPPVEQGLNRFRAVGQCSAPTTMASGDATLYQSNCVDGNEVRLITIAGAGHQWPGARPMAAWTRTFLHPDPPSTALDATVTLWAFFTAHPKIN